MNPYHRRMQDIDVKKVEEVSRHPQATDRTREMIHRRMNLYCRGTITLEQFYGSLERMKIELEHPNGFILEHPTRGTLQHIEWDPFRTPPRWVPVFAWASPRSNAQLFTSLGAAEETRTKLPEGQLRDRTRILAFGTWKEVG